MRPYGLAGDQRKPFGLLRAVLFEQELGERALALAECRAILERGEDPDRFAEEALRPWKLALASRHPRREVERSAERPGGSGFGEVPTSGLQRGVDSVELPAIQMELAREAERPAAGLGTAALLGQQDRLLDERRRAGELESREVDACELVRRLTLEVLPPGLPREGQGLAHHLLLLGEVAPGPGDRRAGPERAETTMQVVRLEDPQRLFDHLFRGPHVGFPKHDGLREGHQCAPLRPAVAGFDRAGEDLLHL